VNLGKQARSGSVTVEGASESEAAHLVRSLRFLRARLSGGLLKSGKPYSAPRIDAATALMKKGLVGQRRLASHVQENPPEFHAETNRVDVSFRVEV
jgi:hypothetical protein